MREATVSKDALTSTKCRRQEVVLERFEFVTTLLVTRTRTIQPKIEVRISTTIRDGTMTTRVEHQLSRDLRRNPGWPIFSRLATAPASPKLCASTVVWTEDSGNETALQRRAGAGLTNRITVFAREMGLSVLVFIATSTPQPNSTVVRHRRLWRSPMMGSVPALEKQWPEAIVECGARVRIATLAAVPASALQWMLQVNESFDSAVPVLLPSVLSLDDRAPIDLLHAAFPPDGCRPTPDFDWPEFSTTIAALGGISVRRTNEYSDRRVSVDFFGLDDYASQIADLAIKDDEVTRARVR